MRALARPLPSSRHPAEAGHTLSRRALLQAAGGTLGLALAMGVLMGRVTDVEAADHLVLIVLDGARPEYFEVPDTPNLQRLKRNGVYYRNAFAGILEAETPPGHVAIATGCEPRLNGIVNFWWGDASKQKVDLFSPDIVRAGALEDIIRKAGVPTIAGLVHSQRPGAKVVALSGSKYYAADALGGPDGDATMYFYGTPSGMFVPTYIPGHAPPDGVLDSPHLTTRNDKIPPGVENHMAMTLAVDTFNRMKNEIMLINMPEFDWPLGHVEGSVLEPDKVSFLMQSFDRDLGMLQDAYRRAGVLDRTLFVVMADHGMMPLQHTIDSEVLDSAVEAAGTSIVTSSYNTAVAYWIQDSSAAGTAAQNLVNLKSPLIQGVYAADRSTPGHPYVRVGGSGQVSPTAERAEQYLLATFAGYNGPDVLIVLSEGVGCEPGGQAGWKADHGGASWESQHMPLLFSGPGVREGVISSAPARLIDVAPTALTLLGMTPVGMRGTILADAMQYPPPVARRHHAAHVHKLRPVVEALHQESLLQRV